MSSTEQSICSKAAVMLFDRETHTQIANGSITAFYIEILSKTVLFLNLQNHVVSEVTALLSEFFSRLEN